MARQRVQRLYKRDDAGLGGSCVYCGIRADTEDHVPPLSAASEMRIEDLRALKPRLFPACRNCNSALGATLELLLVDRRDIIANYLERKRKRMLARGMDIYERKLAIFSDPRELACLQVYERWLFASITTNEATPEPEPEEVYVRERFYPTSRLDVPKDRTPDTLIEKTPTTRSSILLRQKKITIANLADVDPKKVKDSDLGKIASGFVNLKEAEIDFVLDCLRKYPIEKARDKCVNEFRPFLNGDTVSFVKSDDGVTFFLAVIFSVNCDYEYRRKILSELKGKSRD